MNPSPLERYRQRFAEGLDPVEHAARLQAWLNTYGSFCPVIDLAEFHVVPLSFSGESFAPYATLERFTETIAHKLAAAGATLGYGGYLERRPFYSTDLFAAASETPRDLHLGVDLWCPAGTPIRAPLAGVVHSLANNNRGRDYGGTVILEHQVDDLRFWTLYGHLGLAELAQLQVGQVLEAGQVFAKAGTPHENGGWPPHLHLQVITDLLDYSGDFPGVAPAAEGPLWSSLVLDASCLAGLPPTPTSSRP